MSHRVAILFEFFRDFFLYGQKPLLLISKHTAQNVTPSPYPHYLQSYTKKLPIIRHLRAWAFIMLPVLRSIPSQIFW